MSKDDRTEKGAGGPAAPPTAVAVLRDALSHVYDSSVVFGDPVVFADRAVIPAAKVSSGGGGGYGLTPAEDGDDAAAEEGAGMGHGVHATPIGYIEVTAEGSRWVPAFDVGAVVRTITVGVVLVTLVFFFRRRRCRRCR